MSLVTQEVQQEDGELRPPSPHNKDSLRYIRHCLKKHENIKIHAIQQYTDVPREDETRVYVSAAG